MNVTHRESVEEDSKKQEDEEEHEKEEDEPFKPSPHDELKGLKRRREPQERGLRTSVGRRRGLTWKDLQWTMKSSTGH